MQTGRIYTSGFNYIMYSTYLGQVSILATFNRWSMSQSKQAVEILQQGVEKCKRGVEKSKQGVEKQTHT